MFLGRMGLLARWRQRGAPAGITMAEPPLILGEIDERSPTHVSGWIRNSADPTARMPYEVLAARTGQVLASGTADQYRHSLHWRGIGDAACGFHVRLPITHEDVVVRACGVTLPVSGNCRTSFEPFLHVAMDIVDNCNLRCPFCLYDYANTRTTHMMTPETLQSALRFLPYTRDGQFWFSCLHEPTLHPELMGFIDTVPAEYRKKLFYTTNLAKRMPDSYFDWLANSGMFNINVSIESRDPAIYERMRKGARYRIFLENWEKLLNAFARAKSPPLLRYIAMAYKSNIDELPELTRYLLEERQAWQVEIRYTYDAPYIDDDFRQAEFLGPADWNWLRDHLPPYPGDRLILIAPPQDSPPTPAIAPLQLPLSQTPKLLRDYYMLSLSWDGSMRVRGIAADSRNGNAIEHEILTTSLEEIADPEALLDRLATLTV